MPAPEIVRSGNSRSRRPTAQSRAANQSEQPIVDLVARFAERENATRSQIALAWLIARKQWIVPIPGTRNPVHLLHNLGAARIGLSADDLREMDAALAAVTVHGGRMNEEQMQVVDTAA